MKKLLIILSFPLFVFLFLNISYKRGINAIQSSHNKIFCGILVRVHETKLKSGVPIEYYYLKNSENKSRSFFLHYSVTKEQRDMLKINQQFCFSYYNDLLFESVIVKVSIYQER